MIKRYVVVSTWIDKETKKPVSSIAEISEGVNKSGNKYQLAQTERTERVDEAHEVGTILTFTMSRTNAAKV